MAVKRTRAAREEERRRLFQQALRTLLPLPVDTPETAQRLSALGVEPTFLNAMVLSLMDKAIREQNLTAFQALRDTLGEKPGDKPPEPAKPVQAMDLSRLSDEQLAALAQRGDGGD